MKLLSKIFVLCLVLISLTEIKAQNVNQKIEKVKVFGNCTMCKQTIESAGSDPNISLVIWDPGTKIATITYDDTKTSLSAILKKIAKSGYSNEKYKAKDSDYKKLPSFSNLLLSINSHQFISLIGNINIYKYYIPFTKYFKNNFDCNC